MQARVLVASVALLLGACVSSTPSPARTAVPTRTPVATPVAAPATPALDRSVSRPDFPVPRERLAGVTPANAERRLLPACDPTLRPALVTRKDAEPAVSGSVELSVVGQLGGRPRSIAIARDRVYVGVGPRVMIFETDPIWRQADRSVLLPAVVEGLAVDDDLIVAALGDAGIAVFEQLAEGLALSSSLEVGGPAHALALEDRVAYVAAGPAGVRLVDLSDPKRPEILGDTLVDKEVLGVVAQGGLLVAAAGSDGLFIADVSDPRAPAALGSLMTGGYAFAARLVGATIYLADGWGGLRTIDASDPSRPRLLGSLATAGWARAVSVEGGLAYVAAGSQGLIVADVSDPAAPTAVGSAPLSGMQAVGIAVRRDVAYVIDPFEGVQIVGVTSPASLRPIGTWQPLLEGWGFAFAEDRAYVASGRAGLRALDVSEPAHPRDLDGLPTVAWANAVRGSEDGILVSTVPDAGTHEASALIGVDVSDPAHLRPRSAYAQAGRPGRTTFPAEESMFAGSGREAIPPGPALGLGTSGSVTLYANEWGFLIVDAGSGTPCELAFVQTTPQLHTDLAQSVAVNGDVAFVGASGADGGPQILTVDISDPRDPRVLASVLASNDGGLLLNGRWLYAAASFALDDDVPVLTVLDVTEPSRPRPVGSLKLPAEPRYLSSQSMAFAAGRLFIAAGEGGILAVDVSDPRRPRLAGQLGVPGLAVSVGAAGDHLYVGSNEAGLLVVQVGPSRGPAGVEPSGPGWSGIAAGVQRAAVTIADESRATPPSGCLVTTTLGGGPGSLRDCVFRVARGRAVTFDPQVFSPEQPATIRLGSPLALGSGDITVDGGGGVVLDGGGTAEGSFELTGKDRVTLRGLHIRGFRNGLVVDSNGNKIEGNVIAGNDTDLRLARGSGNRIVGNLVSVDAAGLALAYDPETSNPPFDLDLGSAMNHIEGNIFGNGVYVADPGSYKNSFVGNRIGVNAAGQVLPCPFCQLVLDEPFNRVGGLLPGEGNVIAGRILVQQGGNVVLGNTVLAAP